MFVVADDLIRGAVIENRQRIPAALDRLQIFQKRCLARI
jgi:hypothetical protein